MTNKWADSAGYNSKIQIVPFHERNQPVFTDVLQTYEPHIEPNLKNKYLEGKRERGGGGERERESSDVSHHLK